MIEVNLIERKKGGKPVVVLGVDVRTINFKMLFVAILIYYVPKNIMQGQWADELAGVDRQIAKLDADSKAIQEDLKSFEGVKAELEAYNKQIEKLRERSVQVDRILKEKTSPKRLLERMARLSPQDLWFNELVIQEDRTFSLKGGADSYKSIGDLIVAMNETPFFKNTLNLVKSETMNEVEGGREIRTESFEIGGKVESFEIQGR